jgi:MFS transporter, DHA2 family, methylenomycin A resistance protein
MKHHTRQTMRQPTTSSRNLSRVLTLVGASLGFAVVQLDVTIVNVALQRIGDSFGGGVAELQWVVEAYTIVFASLIPTAGALGDRCGAKRVFIAGFGIFTFASAACGAAGALPVLIGSRALQGVGAAALTSCSLALINHAHCDAGARAKAVSIWAAGASVALAAGPVVGGVLVDTIGWRTIFFINVPIGCLGLWLSLRHATESPRSTERGLDVAGQLMIVLTLAALAAAAIESGRLGLGHPFVVAAMLLCALAAGSFILIEANGETPMLPLGFFGEHTFASGIAIGFGINIAYYGLIFLFSLFFQRAKGYSPLLAGAAFLPMTGGVLAANLIAGRLTAKRGPRVPMVAGQAIFAIGCLSLVGITPDTTFRNIWWQLLMMGTGLGLIVPPMTSAVLGAVDRRQSGIASGVLNAARQAGSVIGVALYGSLIAAKAQFTSGTHAALYLSAAVLLLGSGVAFRYIPDRNRIRARSAQPLPHRREAPATCRTRPPR